MFGPLLAHLIIIDLVPCIIIDITSGACMSDAHCWRTVRSYKPEQSQIRNFAGPTRQVCIPQKQLAGDSFIHLKRGMNATLHGNCALRQIPVLHLVALLPAAAHLETGRALLLLHGAAAGCQAAWCQQLKPLV